MIIIKIITASMNDAVLIILPPSKKIKKIIQRTIKTPKAQPIENPFLLVILNT